MPGKGRGELVTLALMALATAFLGGSFVAGKIALREFPPMTLTFFRFLIAILFSYLVLGDPVTPVNIVSAGIIITVVVLN